MKLKFNFPPFGKNGFVKVNAEAPTRGGAESELFDRGNRPSVFDLKRSPEHLRVALWTGKYMQLASVSIPIAKALEGEVYADLDRMIIAVSGYAQIESDSPVGEAMTYSVRGGHAVIIPAGAEHTIRNKGNTPFRFYSVNTHPVLKYGESVK